MKKIAVGFIAGVLFVLCGSVFADSISKIGKTITSEVSVVVNGVNVSTGIVVDNTTFIPVRAVSESLGAEVEWKGAEQKVVISNGVNQSTEELDRIIAENNQRNKEYREKLTSIETSIKMTESKIKDTQDKITFSEGQYEIALGTYKEKLANDIVKFKEELASLQEELEKYKTELEELESAK